MKIIMLEIKENQNCVYLYIDIFQKNVHNKTLLGSLKRVFFSRTPPGVRNGITYGVRNEWKGGVRNQRGGVRNKFEIFKKWST